MTLKLVRLVDLLDTPCDGLRVDIRSRTANGELMYDHTRKELVCMVNMKEVVMEDRKHHRRGLETWLIWRWWSRVLEGRTYDCGYSGICMNGEREMDYHLLVEVAQ